MNAILKLSQLNGLISDIFDGFGNAVTNILNAFFAYFATAMYQFLIVPLLLIMNGIQILFRKMAGLDSSYVIDGQSRSGDIVLSLIENKTVQNIFWSLLILAVVLLFLTTIVALVKSEVQAGEKDAKTKSQILVSALRGLVSFFMVPVVAILGVVMGNALLNALDKATSTSDITIGGVVFKACASECNRARIDSTFAEDIVNEHYNDMGLFKNDTNTDQEYVANKIDEAFVNFTRFSSDSDGSLKLDKWGSLFTEPGGSYTFQTSLAVFSYGTALIPRSMFSIYDACQVYYYYNLVDFNFLVAIIASIFVCYVLFVTSIGLIKRIYKLTALLVVSPVIASLYPLDNGGALKKWRESFVSSTLSAYSTIVVLNIMLALLGPLTKLDLFPNTSTGVGGALAGIGLGVLNNLASLLIICGGFAFFKELTDDLGKIIGAENAYAQGASAAKNMAAVAGKVAGAAMGFGGALGAGIKASANRGRADRAGEEADRIAKENGIDTSDEGIEALRNKNPKELTAAETAFLNQKDLQKHSSNAAEKYQKLASVKFKNARDSAAGVATGGLVTEVKKGIYGDKYKEDLVKAIKTAREDDKKGPGTDAYGGKEGIIAKAKETAKKSYKQRFSDKSSEELLKMRREHEDNLPTAYANDRKEFKAEKNVIKNIGNEIQQRPIIKQKQEEQAKKEQEKATKQEQKQNRIEQKYITKDEKTRAKSTKKMAKKYEEFDINGTKRSK